MESQVKNVEDIVVKRDTENLGILRKEVIEVISELGQAKYFVQAENHLDYLIRAKRLTHLKSLVRLSLPELKPPSQAFSNMSADSPELGSPSNSLLEQNT